MNVPVVAIGGIDASNARDCINAGAAGVAVVRASADARGARRARCLGSLTSASSGCSPSSSGAGSRTAIENDVAEIAGAVVTQDTLVEGVHFRLDWISWRELGFRAAAVNLSDLAAAGATPDGLIVSIGAPGETLLEQVLELYEGLAEAGVPIVGGDTTRADALVLSVTAIGRSERVPGRGGARPGDLLVVTGPLGAAGAAFRRGAYVRPPLRLEEGRRLAAHAHALLDISDGIARDAAHLAARSGCKVVIELEHVPLAPGAEPGRPRLRRGLRAARCRRAGRRLCGDRAL